MNTENDNQTLINETNETNENNEQFEKKVINIIGTNNKYMMKKILNNNKVKEVKKRVESKKWKFTLEDYDFDAQLDLINDIYKNNYHNHHQIMEQQVEQHE